MSLLQHQLSIVTPGLFWLITNPIYKDRTKCPDLSISQYVSQPGIPQILSFKAALEGVLGATKSATKSDLYLNYDFGQVTRSFWV